MGGLVPGVNDLATTHPDLAAQALFDPTSVEAESSRKVPWRCSLGHRVLTSPETVAATAPGTAWILA